MRIGAVANKAFSIVGFRWLLQIEYTEGDVIRTIRDSSAHIGHYHTAGNPGRHELDDNQELYYPAIMRAIAATGYEGFVGQELVPTGDPFVALEQAYRYLSRLGMEGRKGGQRLRTRI